MVVHYLFFHKFCQAARHWNGAYESAVAHTASSWSAGTECRDRAGHTATATGVDCRDVPGRGARDDRLCGLLVAAAGASARMAHEQRHGRLALGRVLRRLRPRGPVSECDHRPGRCPLCLHPGCGALRRRLGRACVPRNGILVCPAVARDRGCRAGRHLHAGPQGAHRPAARGATGTRGGLLHVLVQHRHCGVLFPRRRRAGVVRLAWRLPVRGSRPGPQRHRPRNSGRTAGAGSGHRGAQARTRLPPGAALAGDDGLHHRLCRPRGRTLRHALLDRALPRVLPG